MEMFSCSCTYFATVTCNCKLLESILSNSMNAIQLHTISVLSKFLKARTCAYKAALNFLKLVVDVNDDNININIANIRTYERITFLRNVILLERALN